METESLSPNQVTDNSNISDVENSKTIKIITWNLGGLQEKNLEIRTEATCKILAKENADIVYLQEVIPETASQIEQTLQNYQCLFGKRIHYFTGVLLNKDTVLYEDHRLLPFVESRQGRNLLTVKVKVAEQSLFLMTSHLESGVSFERMKQLKSVLELATNALKKRDVIFGGDLNIRDRELDSLDEFSDEIEDLWDSCGSPKDCEYTWDMLRNDNLSFTGFKPRIRFDRLYLRKGPESKIIPKRFGLLGLERISHDNCFPSDHWGVYCVLDIPQ